MAFRYNLFVVGLYAIMVLFLSRVYNAYAVEYHSAVDVACSLTLSTTVSISGDIFITLLAWKRYYPISCFFVLFLFQTGFNFLWALLAKRLYSAIHPRMPIALIIGSKRDSGCLEKIRGFHRHYRVNTVVEAPSSLEEVKAALEGCEGIFLSRLKGELRDSIVTYCAEKGIRIFLLPDLGDIIVMGGTHMQVFSVPVVRVWPEYHLEINVLKRAVDILISFLLILITGPIMLVVAFFIWREDRGPVFYSQKRLTKDGKVFSILKFRSMRIDAESDGVARLSSGENDIRITKVGRIIRAARIDELPQLFNVLRGDMSLVGPRPERPEIAAQYEKDIPEFRLRLSVKAGLTGYAQVYGKYNSDPYEKLQMDFFYINKMTPLLDLRILLATIRILFMKDSTEGVTPGSVTALQEEARLEEELADVEGNGEKEHDF